MTEGVVFWGFRFFWSKKGEIFRADLVDCNNAVEGVVLGSCEVDGFWYEDGGTRVEGD